MYCINVKSLLLTLWSDVFKRITNVYSLFCHSIDRILSFHLRFSIKRLLFFGRLYKRLFQKDYHPLQYNYQVREKAIHAFIDRYMALIQAPVDDTYDEQMKEFAVNFTEYAQDNNVDYLSFYSITSHQIQDMVIG